MKYSAAPRLCAMTLCLITLSLLLPCALIAASVADHSWVDHVSDKDRTRTNPLAGSDAVSAGAVIFSEHCSKCHGSDAMGKGKKPSLRTRQAQQSSDGELFWLLSNGYLKRGMPSWSKIPEPSRWQLVAYLKSLAAQE